METEWNQARIQQYIDDEIQENLLLDYKSADALARSDRKKDEITKDVAAMANSAGGIIIYGIKEFDESDKNHLPQRIDAVDLTQFSKEWLEQVMMNIRPRIDGVIVHPVSINSSPNSVVYVVEIPQSTTAHQSNDHRYYKRFNFMSVPMEDYEIRDIMSRVTHPKIGLRFEIEITTHTRDNNVDVIGITGIRRGDLYGLLPPDLVKYYIFTLKTYAFNSGSVYGQYVRAEIEHPYDLLPNDDYETSRIINLDEVVNWVMDNTVRDIISVNMLGNYERAAARYVPILPSVEQQWENIQLNGYFQEMDWGDKKIKWIVYCDNAQPNKGEIAIKDIPIINR